MRTTECRSARETVRKHNMKMLIFTVSLSLLSTSAQAQTEDVPAEELTVPVSFTFADAVRCTSIYHAVSGASALGTDIKNYTFLRAAQWNTAIYGVFQGGAPSMSREVIGAHIQAQDSVVENEIAAAKLASKVSGIETKLFEADLEKCNALFASHQPLFDLVNQALEKEFGEKAGS